MRNIKEEQQCADLFVIPQGYEVLRAAPPPTVRGDPGKAIPTLPWGVLKQPRDAIIDLRARSFEGSKNLMLSKSADMTCARPARNNFAAFPKYIPHVNLGSKRYGCHRASSASFRTPRGVTAESRERSKGMTNKLTTVCPLPVFAASSRPSKMYARARLGKISLHPGPDSRLRD